MRGMGARAPWRCGWGAGRAGMRLRAGGDTDTTVAGCAVPRCNGGEERVCLSVCPSVWSRWGAAGLRCPSL